MSVRQKGAVVTTKNLRVESGFKCELFEVELVPERFGTQREQDWSVPRAK